MKKVLLAAALATIAASAFAQTPTVPEQAPSAAPGGRPVDNPLILKAIRAKEMTKDATPDYGCYDPSDSTSCQVSKGVNGEGGLFVYTVFASGTTMECFSPDHAAYSVCVNNNGITRGSANRHWVPAPVNDDRCKPWGGDLTAEYLVCEAALPPKQG